MKKMFPVLVCFLLLCNSCTDKLTPEEILQQDMNKAFLQATTGRGIGIIMLGVLLKAATFEQLAKGYYLTTVPTLPGGYPAPETLKPILGRKMKFSRAVSDTKAIYMVNTAGAISGFSIPAEVELTTGSKGEPKVKLTCNNILGNAAIPFDMQ